MDIGKIRDLQEVSLNIPKYQDSGASICRSRALEYFVWSYARAISVERRAIERACLMPSSGMRRAASSVVANVFVDYCKCASQLRMVTKGMVSFLINRLTRPCT